MKPSAYSKTLQEQFRSLLESSPDAMVIIDAAGTIVLINGQAERMFLYPREKLLGQKVEMLLPERLRPNHRSYRERYFANPRVRQMGVGLELYGRRKDDSEFPLDIGLSPLQTPQGTLAVSASAQSWNNRLSRACRCTPVSAVTAAFGLLESGKSVTLEEIDQAMEQEAVSRYSKTTQRS